MQSQSLQRAEELRLLGLALVETAAARGEIAIEQIELAIEGGCGRLMLLGFTGGLDAVLDTCEASISLPDATDYTPEVLPVSSIFLRVWGDCHVRWYYLIASMYSLYASGTFLIVEMLEKEGCYVEWRNNPKCN